MIASAPQDLKDFIASKQAEGKKDAKKQAAIDVVLDKIAEIEKLEQLPAAQSTLAEAGISAAFEVIGGHVIVLLSTSDWGSDANPLPLEYTKRRAASYPPVFIGPKCEQRIEQKLLETRATTAIETLLTAPEKKAWDASGLTIEKYTPTERKALPTGGPTIGLDPKYTIAVGKKVKYKPGKTEGGGLINQTLRPYGYRARAEYRDGDHVVEMQVGGPNILENLWPLDASENRSSGAALAARKVKKPDGKEITLDDAAKAKPDLWLIIVKTL
jgi:hypothetical protein